MKLEVLISCMHQTDLSLIDQSHITTDVLMINQTDHNAETAAEHNGRHIRCIHTTDRGLSKSRNLALAHTIGDICLICDDDEILADNYEQTILAAFRQFPEADIIGFRVENQVTRLRQEPHRIGRLGALKLVSYQLAIRKRSLEGTGIRFDEYMGAGSGNGCGEENKFLWDCIRQGLKVYYVPESIGQVCPKSSTWFFGFDETFFYQRGGATRYMMGLPLAVLYGVYYIVVKRPMYRADISSWAAARELLRGMIENPIYHQAKTNKAGSNE